MKEHICTPLQWEELRNIWVVQKPTLSTEQFGALLLDKVNRIVDSSEKRAELLKRIDDENVLSKQVWKCLLQYYVEGMQAKEVVYENIEKEAYWVLKVTSHEIRVLEQKIRALCDSVEDAYDFAYILSNLHYEKQEVNAEMQTELAGVLDWLHSWIENTSVPEEDRGKQGIGSLQIIQRFGAVLLLIGGGWLGFMCMS